MILVDRTEKNPERRIRRFRPLQPIPVDAVRLSPTDVELFLETFNIRGKNFVRLLEEFDTGERFPALRTQLASVDGAWRAGAESKRLEPGAAAQAPMPQAEVASPRAGYGVSRGKGEPKTREDSLSMQLVDLIGQMRRANEPVNAATVMHRLRKSQGDPGSCVVDQKADGVIYEKTMGSTALLTRAALHKRIKRFLEKGLV
jgi:hypothetical protein